MSAVAKRARTEAATAGAPGKHLAPHATDSGQDDFGQSGGQGFWSGQQGMPCDTEARSDIAAIGPDSIALATDGVTVGAIKKLTIAKIESRRGNSDQSFTDQLCHRTRRKKRRRPSRLRQIQTRPSAFKHHRGFERLLQAIPQLRHDGRSHFGIPPMPVLEFAPTTNLAYPVGAQGTVDCRQARALVPRRQHHSTMAPFGGKPPMPKRPILTDFEKLGEIFGAPWRGGRD